MCEHFIDIITWNECLTSLNWLYINEIITDGTGEYVIIPSGKITVTLGKGCPIQ
jgi:hypothetical protein